MPREDESSEVSETPRGSAAGGESSRVDHKGSYGDGVLPPLQEWIDKQYKDVKKDFHGIREKIMESQPDREPYMPYCFNSLLAYTNTDVPHYAFYKRYEETPGGYCQRRTAIRITDPEISWKMDNVLFLSDYEMHYKPYTSDPEDEEEEPEEVTEETEETGETTQDDTKDGEGDKEGDDNDKKQEKDARKKPKPKQALQSKLGKSDKSKEKQQTKKQEKSQKEEKDKKDGDAVGKDQDGGEGDERQDLQSQQTSETEKEKREKRKKTKKTETLSVRTKMAARVTKDRTS
ncbi:uncharacterized protein LOC142353568 isoform X2 [Convolutriloba macropyga]|uniref:uncharacterized protein LOC142353568 isoform X2 n=1 Tax=Convolutriloba macropyga TaxID=536237 RepID=UPI003F52091A